MKKFSAVLLAGFAALFAGADTLTISECYKLARENYPMIKKFSLIKEAEKYDLENASRGYLPQFSLGANAMYLSDTPEIMGQSFLPQEQYRAQIGVNQVLWDGGNISANKHMTRAQAKVEIENNEVILYELNDRINRLFFGILLQNEALAQNAIHQKDIKDAIASVEAMIANGSANEYDLNLLKVELLRVQQKESEVKASREAYRQMLSFMVNKKIGDSTTLEIPQAPELGSGKIARPELAYYTAREEFFDAKKDIVGAGLMPKISLFGYGGYGQSSFASLRDEKLYGVGGISFSWSFGNYYTERNERLKISADKSAVRAQSEAFIFNTRLQMMQEDGEIKKMSELVARDAEIVRLRRSIKDIAFARMNNGAISTTDFIRELNAKDLAEQAYIQHKLEKLSRQYNYKYLTND